MSYIWRNYKLCMNFLEYSTAQKRAPVAGNVRIKEGKSPLYKPMIPSVLKIMYPALNMGSEMPET